jgi:hypothetical protein
MKSRILLVLLTLVGCSDAVEKSQIPGVYEFALNDLRQTIEIAADGRYTNTFQKAGVTVWSDQQAWVYEAQGGKDGVTFTGFRFGIPGHPSAPGMWFVVPDKRFSGAKELCFNSDLGRCFRSR